MTGENRCCGNALFSMRTLSSVSLSVALSDTCSLQFRSIPPVSLVLSETQPHVPDSLDLVFHRCCLEYCRTFFAIRIYTPCLVGIVSKQNHAFPAVRVYPLCLTLIVWNTATRPWQSRPRLSPVSSGILSHVLCNSTLYSLSRWHCLKTKSCVPGSSGLSPLSHSYCLKHSHTFLTFQSYSPWPAGAVWNSHEPVSYTHLTLPTRRTV